MNNIDAIISLLKSLLASFAGFFVYNQGKKAEKLKSMEKQAEIDEKARKIQDRVDSDNAYRDKLRDHFSE